MKLFMKLFETAMFLLVCGAFIYSAIVADGEPWPPRLAQGGIAVFILTVGLLMIWLLPRKKK